MNGKRKTTHYTIVKQRRIFLLTVFPAMQVVLMTGLMYHHKALKNPGFLFFCTAIAIAFVIACILMVRVINDTVRLEETRREVEYLQYEKDADIRYYELAKINEKYLLDFQEEIESHINTAHSLFEQQGDLAKESGMKIVEEIKQKSEKFAKLKYCESKIVNTVLSLKTIEASEAGLNAEIAVNVPEELPVSQIDLCSIFSNLYDNAIEALRGAKTDIPISIKAQSSKGYFVVKVCNATNKTARSVRHYTSESTKRDREQPFPNKDGHKHGYGLIIIRDIAQKYQGYVSINEKADSFEITTALRI